MTTIELGQSGRPGDGYVRSRVEVVFCGGVLRTPGACPDGLPTGIADCADPTQVDYALGFQFDGALTTGSATAEITNARQGGTPTLTRTGAPFDCNAFNGENHPGRLVLPLLVTNVDVINADTSLIAQFRD